MRRILSAVTLGVLFLAAPSVVAADPILRLEQGSHVVTLSDSDGDGVVGFVGSIGTYQLNLTFGTSGTGSGLLSDFALLDLISGDATASGGTLKITLADDDFELASSASSIVAKADVNGTLIAPFGGAVTFQSWINLNNASPLPSSPTTIPGGSTPLYTPLASFTHTAWSCLTCSFSASDTTTVAYNGGPFSLFSQAIISLNGAGGVLFNQGVQVSGPRGVTAVPEPASMALALAGFAALAAASSRRRRLDAR